MILYFKKRLLLKDILRFVLFTFLILFIICSILKGKLILSGFGIFFLLFLIGFFIEYKAYYVNTDLTVVLNEMINLVNFSNEEIFILSNKLNPALFCSSSMIDALVNSIERGVCIVIITDFKKAFKLAKDEKRMDIFRLVKNQKILIYDFNEKVIEYPNWILVDKRNFRIEKNCVSVNNSIKRIQEAMTVYDSKAGKVLYKRFTTLIDKGHVVKIKPEDFEI